jgi:hypothetical protein
MCRDLVFGPNYKYVIMTMDDSVIFDAPNFRRTIGQTGILSSSDATAGTFALEYVTAIDERKFRIIGQVDRGGDVHRYRRVFEWSAPSTTIFAHPLEVVPNETIDVGPRPLTLGPRSPIKIFVTTTGESAIIAVGTVQYLGDAPIDISGVQQRVLNVSQDVHPSRNREDVLTRRMFDNTELIVSSMLPNRMYRHTIKDISGAHAFDWPRMMRGYEPNVVVDEESGATFLV